MSGLRVANAPVSYGAFELTIDSTWQVPDPDDLLAAIAGAGYEGTELGSPGYLGESRELRARLDRHNLALTGGWCPIRFSEPDCWPEDLEALDRTLSLFTDAGAPAAHPVFGDAGSDRRRRRPGGARLDSTLTLDARGWRRFFEGLARASTLARERGFEPVFHPHAGTYVETREEIERLLETSDVALAVDPAHLALGGVDPVRAVLEWAPRVGYVHLKDVRMEVVDEALADGCDLVELWRRRVFCELGGGSLNLEAFVDALERIAYRGWLCIEQDYIPSPGEQLSLRATAQERNLRWLRARVRARSRQA